MTTLKNTFLQAKIMYTIYTTDNKDAAAAVYIDHPNPPAVPVSVAIGVGNKKARYKAWLDRCFKHNNRLLEFMAFVHKLGKEKGSVALICRCKHRDIHAVAIKEFLEDNASILDDLLPYMFPDAGFNAEKKLQAEVDLDLYLTAKQPKLNFLDEVAFYPEGEETSEPKANPQLTDEDYQTIQRLIKEHESDSDSSSNNGHVDMGHVTASIEEQRQQNSQAVLLRGEIVNDTVAYSAIDSSN